MNDVVILVPARGGSKRLPGKNIRSLCGKSLLRWTAEAIQKGAPNIPIFLSTDNAAIAEEGHNLGWTVPFMRPASLATDVASSVEVAVHFLDFLAEKNIQPKILLLLQPTSPFRSPGILNEAIALMELSLEIPAVVSMKRLDRVPATTFTLNSKGGVTPLSSSQSPLLTPNGALYAIRVPILYEKRTFIPEGSVPLIQDQIESIDIDTAFDWRVAESFSSEWDR
ncbi:MAG: acylneuraminate cytidylyltransferase family protein [Alphaproteobacteria bacterium]